MLVFIMLLPIRYRYNVYTCHSPIYHYIIVTVVYLVFCIIAVCRGYVIIELVSHKDE